jgi:hypothetical protein
MMETADLPAAFDLCEEIVAASGTVANISGAWQKS